MSSERCAFPTLRVSPLLRFIGFAFSCAQDPSNLQIKNELSFFSWSYRASSSFEFGIIPPPRVNCSTLSSLAPFPHSQAFFQEKLGEDGSSLF